jgi:hypothetical protein
MSTRKKSFKVMSLPCEVDAHMWHLRQQGKTLEYISIAVDKPFKYVAERMRDISEELYKSQLSEIKAQQSIQLAQLDFIIECAMTAWEKSCKDDQETEIFSEFKKTKGDYIPKNKRVLKRSSNGDSSYLAIILKAQADKRKILGIETGKPDLTDTDVETVVRYFIPDDGRNAE